MPACCSRVAVPSSSPQAAPHPNRAFLPGGAASCPRSGWEQPRSREAKAITGSKATQPMKFRVAVKAQGPK